MTCGGNGYVVIWDSNKFTEYFKNEVFMSPLGVADSIVVTDSNKETFITFKE